MKRPQMTTTPSLPHRTRAAYTVQEARQMLGGISQATFYGLVNRGELRTFRIGRRRLVSADAIADYIKGAERKAGAA